MKQLFWVVPRDKGALLVAIMRELASSDTSIALEGDAEAMASLSLPGSPDMARNLSPPFSCQWSSKTSSFIILPLTSITLKPIVSEILSEGKFAHRIGAIQIQVHGELQLLVGDNFHRECVSTGPLISRDFLQDLADRGIVRAIYTPSEARARYQTRGATARAKAGWSES